VQKYMGKNMQDRKDEFRYTMSLNVTQLSEGEKAGDVWYPDIPCRTTLTFVHYTDDVGYKFAEEPVERGKGAKCRADTLTIKPQGRDQAEIQFFLYMNPVPVGKGMLKRVTPMEAK
jgi:hypothetical protein